MRFLSLINLVGAPTQFLKYLSLSLIKFLFFLSLLKRISKNGHKGFYEGETAKLIVSDINKNGGYLSLEDLKNYKALSLFCFNNWDCLKRPVELEPLIIK